MERGAAIMHVTSGWREISNGVLLGVGGGGWHRDEEGQMAALLDCRTWPHC